MDKSRVMFAYVFVIILFIALYSRYFFLQLISHNTLLKQSIKNYSSIISTIPIRGEIVDANGERLAYNKISYAISILKKSIKLNKDLYKRLSKYVYISTQEKKRTEILLRKIKNYDWLIIKDDLSDKEVAQITAHSYDIPEINLYARIKRSYQFDELYAHSIGNVSKISDKIKSKIDTKNYTTSDYIGVTGLEKYYETQLRGLLGQKKIKTNAAGNEVGLVSNLSAQNGLTLKITIINKIQKLAWDLLGDNKGAVVALNPQNGAILVFVSKPSYNPNLFVDGITQEDWSNLANSKNYPLLNRAVQSVYPPGSIFKPFLALAALYYNVINKHSTIYDDGYFILPGTNHKFRDSERTGGRGTIDLYKAITYSSDTYFYKLGLDLGINKADKFLNMFYFGRKIDIDFPNQNKGILPSPEWKKKRFKHDNYQKLWHPVDSVVFGIGQGFSSYSPLQMAFATSIIANYGKVIMPHFIDSLSNDNGVVIKKYQEVSYNLPIKRSLFEFIHTAMRNVVENGTAKNALPDLKYVMAGKTGTAQVVALKENRESKYEGNKYKDHSWFIAFAPENKPEIVVAVIVENGGWGASAAAPLARKVIDEYLLNKDNNIKTMPH